MTCTRVQAGLTVTLLSLEELTVIFCVCSPVCLLHCENIFLKKGKKSCVYYLNVFSTRHFSLSLLGMSSIGRLVNLFGQY